MTNPGSRPTRVPPRPVPLAMLRSIITVHALAVSVQPMLAGQFLSGNFDMVEVHGVVALLVTLLALTQILFAVLLWRPGRGPLWPVGASLLVFLAEGLQTGVGYARLLSLHVPLGVAIFGIMLLLLVWVWRPRLGVPPKAGTGSTPTTSAATR
ncbi:MAG: hypothetical protein GEV03_03455 [Streptosporangiales bacterium]|nr:hypothetical protein [Streptosporangiales bacterium]